MIFSHELSGFEMKSSFYRKLTSRLMIVVGLSLIFVNTLDFVMNVSVVEENIEHFDDSIPGYNYPVRDPSKLQVMLAEPMAKFDLAYLNDTIFESIAHSDKRYLHIYENWLLWLGGKFYPPLSRSQDPERIVSGGAALCSEVSAVLNAIAKRNGFETRFVGLNGHVVSEILTDKGWRVVDPDYGITFPVGLEVLEKETGSPIIRRLLMGRGYKIETIDWYLRIFQSEEDNVVTAVDIALSPRLYAVELISEWLKWIIPVLILSGGIRLGRKRNGLVPC